MAIYDKENIVYCLLRIYIIQWVKVCYILLLKFDQEEPIQAASFVFFNKLLLFLSSFLHSDKIRSSRVNSVLLFLLWHQLFLLEVLVPFGVEWYIESKNWVVDVLSVIGLFFLPGPFRGQS